MENHNYIEHNIIDETNIYFKEFKPADFNNDGTIDFIVKNQDNEQFIWNNNGRKNKGGQVL